MFHEHRRLWWLLGGALLVAFTLLGAFGTQVYRQKPPIPARVVTPDGAVLMTVGDSRYSGVLVDVGDILSELAESAGYVCEAVTPIRAMRTSAQQGGEHELSEDLVRLRPA